MKIKRMIFLPLILMIALLCPSLASAADGRNIADISGRLPDIELDRLEEILENVSGNTGFNISALITDNLDGKTATEYAQDYYSSEYPQNPDGVLLLINFDTNNDIILAFGNAQQYFTESVRKDILSEYVTPFIADGHISSAVAGFSEKSQEILTAAAEETVNSYDEPEIQNEKSCNTAAVIVSGLITGVLIGTLTGFYVKSRYKRSECEFAVSNYKCSHKQNFDVYEDKFKREFVNKTDNNGGNT